MSKIPYGQVAAIAESVAKRFGVFECMECSIALKREFERHGITAVRLELVAVGVNPAKHGYIIMADEGMKLPFDHLAGAAIATNGRHFGVQVGDHVYDNVFRTGIKRSLWPAQFAAQGRLQVEPLSD
ncbi:MAG: hypothetical protein H6945_12520 [Zoogloeaceae bacterium]|nr:hypothetical protein [Rhodocyclaceae bacterium]MCP5236551.1 hypothetical protein [Zoogloeaceae bacterium]